MFISQNTVTARGRITSLDVVVLLLHRSELNKLRRESDAGRTIVPLSMYFRDGKAKVEIALAEGKRDYDKRQALREAQDKLEAQRAMREANRRGRSVL